MPSFLAKKRKRKKESVNMDKKKIIKLSVFVLTTLLAVVFTVIEPFAGLEKTGMVFLGIFIWWVAMMVIELIPTHMSTLAALVAAVALKCGTTAEAFGAFSGTTVWLLIGAFGLATSLSNSGLLNRLALNIMRLFPGNYTGQVLGLSLASLVCAPCVPSTTAKCSILVPLAGMVGDKMGYEPHSKGAIGLFNVVNVITNFGGCMFLTGGVVVAVIIAMVPDTFTWFGWLKIFLVWGVIMVALTILVSLVFYKPGKEGKPLSKTDIKVMIDELGPMSRKELYALIILVLTIAAWMTEKTHGVPTYAVAIISWVLMTACGLFSGMDFMTKILWPIVVLVGGILGVITLLGITGVGAWISGLVAPAITPFMDTPVLLLIILCLVVTALMFAMVQGPAQAAVFITLLSGTTINPLIIAFTVMLSAQVFVMPFQLATVISAEGVSGGRIAHKDVVPSAWAYIVINIIAIAASVPWWQMLGYIG